MGFYSQLAITMKTEYAYLFREATKAIDKENYSDYSLCYKKIISDNDITFYFSEGKYYNNNELLDKLTELLQITTDNPNLDIDNFLTYLYLDEEGYEEYRGNLICPFYTQHQLLLEPGHLLTDEEPDEE